MPDFEVMWMDEDGWEVLTTHHVGATLGQVLRVLANDIDTGHTPPEAAQVDVVLVDVIGGGDQ